MSTNPLLVWDNIPDSVRRNYHNSAKRHHLLWREHFAMMGDGYIYCKVCKIYKLGEAFDFPTPKYGVYIATCVVCKGVVKDPLNWRGDNIYLQSKTWTSVVKGSNALGITTDEYVNKLHQNLRWCTTHKGWYDASTVLDILLTKHGKVTGLIRCRPCDAELKRKGRERKYQAGVRKV